VIRDIRPLSDIIAGSVAERRFFMLLLSVYAVLAMLVAVAGIFGVVAHQVAQRTNEFGVRLALGAAPVQVVRHVLAQSAIVVGIGLVLGLALSFATGRLLASQLFGLSAHDPLLLLTVSTLVLIVAMLASLPSALRAGRVNPMEALRNE